MVNSDIAEYGGHFPDKKLQKEDFKIIDASNGLTALLQYTKISKSVMNFVDDQYPVKLGHSCQQLVKLWQDKNDKLKTNEFNGKQVTIYFTKSLEHDSRLKIVRSDYLSVSIARNPKLNCISSSLRDFYNAGVLICLETLDRKFLIDNSTKLRFPGGFIFGGKENINHSSISAKLNAIASGQTSFTQLLIETAIKETLEEVAEIEITPAQCQVICAVGEDFMFPSKSTDNHIKQVFCIKSFGVLIKAQLTANDIKSKRNETQAVDEQELKNLTFIDIYPTSNKPIADNFICEHQHFYQYLTQQHFKPTGLSQQRLRQDLR